MSDRSRFGIDRSGTRIEVDVDESWVVFARVRLLIDRRVVTERSTLFGTRLTARSRSGLVVVDVSLGMLGGVRSCVLVDEGRKIPMPRIGGSSDSDPEDYMDLLDFVL